MGEHWGAREASVNLESKVDGQCLPCGSWLSVSGSIFILLTRLLVLQLISFKNEARLLKVTDFEAVFAKR